MNWTCKSSQWIVGKGGSIWIPDTHDKSSSSSCCFPKRFFLYGLSPAQTQTVARGFSSGLHAGQFRRKFSNKSSSIPLGKQVWGQKFPFYCVVTMSSFPVKLCHCPTFFLPCPPWPPDWKKKETLTLIDLLLFIRKHGKYWASFSLEMFKYSYTTKLWSKQYRGTMVTFVFG